MQKIKLLLFISFCLNLYSYSQDITNFEDKNILYRKEKSGGIMIYSSGWGVEYRKGKHLTGYKKRMFEIEFVGIKHPKEIKLTNTFNNRAKSYVYGKLNYLYTLRTGIGLQKIINDKPYWGGIQVRYLFYSGISLGITKPVYLYIDKQIAGSDNPFRSIERYDPNKHDFENIFGRAPFFKGFDKINFHPGIYGRFGFNFEYGAYDEKIKALEVGMIVDIYPKPIEIMAFVKNNNVFLSFYLSFHFGKRSN